MPVNKVKMPPNMDEGNDGSRGFKAEGDRSKLSLNSSVNGKSNSAKNSGRKKNNGKKARKSSAPELTTTAKQTNTSKSDKHETPLPTMTKKTPPNRKILANLHSDLSPKLIGFSTPETVNYGFPLTRAARRKTLQNNISNAEEFRGDSDEINLGATEVRASSAGHEIVSASLDRLPVSKAFESPIDKLLARNGSTVPEETSLKNVPEWPLLPTVAHSENETFELDANTRHVNEGSYYEISEINANQNIEENGSTMQEIAPNTLRNFADWSSLPENVAFELGANELLVNEGRFYETNADESVEENCLTVQEIAPNTLRNLAEWSSLPALTTVAPSENVTFDLDANVLNVNEVCFYKSNEIEAGQQVGKNSDEQLESFMIITEDGLTESVNIVEVAEPNLNLCDQSLEVVMSTDYTSEMLKPEVQREKSMDSPYTFVTAKNEGVKNVNVRHSDRNFDSIDNALLPEEQNSESSLLIDRNDSLFLSISLNGTSVQSPSALSLDSAKGSSVDTGAWWTTISTGDLFWGQVHNFCYWPCMVCPDPVGKILSMQRVGRKLEEQEAVHVRFFNDNLRRNYIIKENLIPYTSLERYKQHIREARRTYGAKSTKHLLMRPGANKIDAWREAIKEANKVAQVEHYQRLEKFYELFNAKKAFQVLQRQRRKESVSIGSLRESVEHYLPGTSTSTLKRDRSPSPCSPAFSPLRPASAIKRRKLSEYVENVSQSPNMDAGISEHISKMAKDHFYKDFVSTMKDFACKKFNIDEATEHNFNKACLTIFGIRERILQEEYRQLLENFNENELGSALVEFNNVGKGLKRLSNRLRQQAARRSINQSSTTKVEPSTNEVESDKKIAQQERRKEPSKKHPVRPIEEVIDDIYSLDNKYLFEGMGHDPVCKYCYEPGGQLSKCSKRCQSWFHVNCIGRENNTTTTINSKSRRSRRSRKSFGIRGRRESVAVKIEGDAGDNGAVVDHLESDNANIAQSSHNGIADHDMNLMESLDAPEIACGECALNKPPVCSVCNKPSDESQELMMCNMPQCCKAFHPSCCRYWPQAKITKSKNKIESFRCPSHVCQTCVSDDPKGKFQHISNAKLTKCMKCPASYHTDSTCIPAGSQVLTAAQIICPRHSASTKSDMRVNVSWCSICVQMGKVVCCETCPTAVHAECINVTIDPDEGYICEDCESGRLPLYGEMVWAKFNSFRWWPALILPPAQVPDNIMRKAHNPNDLAVRFFGSHDHCWITRRRVYLYVEGDAIEPKPTRRTPLNDSYCRGIKEAKELYNVIKLKKQQQDLLNHRKVALHPQPYVRIKVNRAVPPVKLNVDMKKVSMCNCNPDAEDPCGPKSNCLNRLLLNECNPKICPAGKRCQNQMFESRIYPRMEVVYMNDRGFGLVCREDISKDSFVIEYVGEVINEQEFQQRMEQKSLDRDQNYYFLTLEKDYIDAGPKGNLARFMNHSCDPNCITQKWVVNGLQRIGLFATKDIPANSELTFNYNWDDFLGEKKPCLCNSIKCSGLIGVKYKEDKVTKDLTESDNTKEKTTSKRNGKQARKTNKQRKQRNVKTSRKSLSSEKEQAAETTEFTFNENNDETSKGA